MSEFNITIGQYVKGDSYLHKLDPRFKILATILLIIAIFLIPTNNLINLYIILGLLGFLLLIILTSKLPIMAVLKGLQPILFIGIFTFVLQIIYNPKGNLLYTFNLHFSWISISVAILIVLLWFFTSKLIKYKVLYMFLMLMMVFLTFVLIPFQSFSSASFKIYDVGLLKGSFFCLRFILVIVVSTLLTLSTSTTDINTGLMWLLHPLELIKIPVGTFAMMMSLTLRFIPTIMIETEKIMKAQASRGLDFNEGNIFSKAKQIVTLLVPMLVISLNRAEDLANAMEARGYVVGAKRTNIEELKFKVRDYVGFTLIILLFAGSIVCKVLL